MNRIVLGRVGHPSPERTGEGREKMADKRKGQEQSFFHAAEGDMLFTRGSLTKKSLFLKIKY